MKSCESCKHYNDPFLAHPCDKCYYTDDAQYWEPHDHVSELIEAAERKAFQAGWEGAIDTYEAGEVREYLHEDFEKWKEESK